MVPLRVKICGITNPADARRAAAMGADAIGVNFYPQSPRYVDPARIHEILRALPPFVEPVGVFVNQPLSQIFVTLSQLGGMLTIQTHGEQRELSDTFPFRHIPAFPVKDERSLVDIRRYLDVCRGLNRLPAAILVDAQVDGQYGGTGHTAPWHVLAGFRPEIPLILAGGLTPDNVAEAIRIVRPYGVDVASGVESSPGVKDPGKLYRFIQNARHAGTQIG